MACTWGSKVNGILTVFAVGAAVVFDLWNVLDHTQEGHTMVGFHLKKDKAVVDCCPALLLEALPRTRSGPDPPSLHCLPLILLGSFHRLEPVRYW